MTSQPPLFKPFRALGYITEDAPFAVQRQGKETFVTVSVGKAWQVYNCGKLTLVLVGPQLPGTIRALAAKGDITLAAVGNSIIVCKRVHRLCVLRGHAAPILQLLVLGNLVLSLDTSGQLLTWALPGDPVPQASMQLPAGFRPTCMAHPDTYLNKLVIGSEGGQLLLLNFVTGSVLYTFKGWGCAVRGLSSSPALDVMGVALADGRAALHNLRFDEPVVVFSNAAGVGLASGITGPGVPLMAAAGGAGVITVWNLESRTLHTVIRDAHDAAVVALHFFAGEPLLMSAGKDNALKHWVFDSADPSARLLRFRSGHAAPPTVVAHYGEGQRLLSAGSDRAFRVFSTIQDQQSRELSQKNVSRRAKKLKVRESEIKLPRVVALDACVVRERDWANVITAHEGDPTAYVWRLAHFTLGEHELRPPLPPPQLPPSGGALGGPVTSVALSPCGNFGVVGSGTGRLDKYNMQSGIHRGVFGRQPPAGTGVVQQAAHDGPITGLGVDSCNRILVSTGLDGWLRLWDFKSLKLRCEVCVGSPVSRLALHPGTGLAAVACDDQQLHVYDIEAEGRLVRRFKGHRDRVTALQISSDSRWLISAALDGCLRVWDIAASHCLQALRLGAPITAFSLSPALDMLATCHINRRGVYLWSNQAVFGNPADFIPSDVPVDLALPSLAGGSQASSTKGEAGQKLDVRGSGAPQPLAPSMVTLSLLPRAQWQSLVQLEEIKARNKPIEPPKKPEAAPFFLPTVSGLSAQPVFNITGTEPQPPASAHDPATSPAADAKPTRGSGAMGLTPFLRLLREGREAGDYASFLALLRELSPVAVDREVRAMQQQELDEQDDPLTAAAVADVAALLDCCLAALQQGTSFEYCQALLQLVLQVHGEAISERPSLQRVAQQLLNQLKPVWRRLDNLMQNCRCMVSYFGNLQA
ncbi:WD40 repeat-like protein [Haematococcus lacustris]